MENETGLTIEKLLERLEEKDISLEESFRCYEAGMDHLRVCSRMIDEVDKKVQMLKEDGTFADFNEV